MCSDHFFAVSSRNALSRPPTSGGYHRCRHRHLTHIPKLLQRIAWHCTYCSTPGSTYLDGREENAHLPGVRSIARTNLLRSIGQNTWVRSYQSDIMVSIWKLYLIGSYSCMGFREL